MTTVQKWIKEQSEYVANNKSVTSNSYYDLLEQVVITSYVCMGPIPQWKIQYFLLLHSLFQQRYKFLFNVLRTGGGGGRVMGVVGELGGGSGCGGRTREVVVGVVGELGKWLGVVGELGGW